MSEHAPVSPSALHRQLACPGARKAEAVYPDSSSPAAVDGTGSHELLELCINNKVQAAHYIGQTIKEGHEDKPGGWLVNEERAERVQMALTYVESRVNQLIEQGHALEDIEVHSEIKSNPGMSFNRGDWYGTSDIVIKWPVGLEIADYKDGRGYVSEKDNPQLLSYLYGVHAPQWYTPDKSCRVTIIQPKTNNPIRFQNMTGSRAMAEAVFIHQGIQAGDVEGAPFVSGEHCKYCKHKPNCPTHAVASAEGVKSMNEIMKVDEVMRVPVVNLTGKQISQLLDTKEAILSRFKEVEDEAVSRVGNDSEAIPGYAMKPCRGTRKYVKSEDEVMAALKKLKMPMAQYQEISLRSIAQLEKQEYMKSAPKRWTSFERAHVAVVMGKDKLSPVSRSKQEEKRDAVSLFESVPM